MGRAFAEHMFGDAKTERRQVYAGEQVFALSQHDGRNREMHLVDQAGLQILPHGRDAAADAHVASAGRRPRLSSAAPIPSVTKWKTVPPSMTIGARG